MWKFFVIAQAIVLAASGQVNAQVAGQRAYVLATEQGLFRIDTQGRVQQKLSATEAFSPRYLPTSTCSDIVFFHRTSSGTTEIKKLRTTDGIEESITTVPTFHESDFIQQGDKTPVHLELARESAVAIGESELCIHMMDRNLNMAQYEAHVRIDIKTRKVHVLSLGCIGDTCKPGLPFQGMLSPACNLADSNQCSRPIHPSKNRYPFRIKQQMLIAVDRRGKERSIVNLKDRSNWGWQEWGPASPSGRWQLLEGNLEDGSDSLFRQALMLDRKTGLLYPLPQTSTPRRGQQLPWPRPLSPKQLQSINSPASLSTLVLSATSEVRTLDLDDQILVDGWIVTPGKHLTFIGGDLAY